MLNNSPITLTNHVKYLGVFIESKLNFHFYLNVVVNKLFRSVGILYKLKHVLPKNALLKLYYSLIHPHFTDWWRAVPLFPLTCTNLLLFKI